MPRITPATGFRRFALRFRSRRRRPWARDENGVGGHFSRTVEMKRAVIAAALLAVSFPLIAQESGKGVLGQVGALGQEVKRAPVQTGPAPRLPDGTIDLDGLWIGGGPVFHMATQGGIKPEDVPMLPAAR